MPELLGSNRTNLASPKTGIHRKKATKVFCGGKMAGKWGVTSVHGQGMLPTSRSETGEAWCRMRSAVTVMPYA
ncbi:MAG: hypothetical protein C7B43_14870 [Sulfobacillus benefaciens]|uniref:Uncharacterized protein n=1 Tax=Sulfobacillus benefaciens TaxID=453960 RepID=A0A2T2WV29_9FIRM|nr:MAG: hypothetical protein C7B43_14870 [Sulfobacillus benefaciens]